MAKATAGLGDRPLTIADGVKKFVDGKSQRASKRAEQVRLWGERWVEFFKARGVTHFEKIQPQHLEEFIAIRKGEVSGKTIKEELFILRGVVRLLNSTRRFSPIMMNN